MRLIDILLDPDNTENIVLSTEDNEDIEFEQIAVVPYQEEIYAVMRPLEGAFGLADDECIVFRLNAEEDSLVVEEDEEIYSNIYQIYLRLLEESDGEDE